MGKKADTKKPKIVNEKLDRAARGPRNHMQLFDQLASVKSTRGEQVRGVKKQKHG